MLPSHRGGLVLDFMYLFIYFSVGLVAMVVVMVVGWWLWWWFGFFCLFVSLVMTVGCGWNGGFVAVVVVIVVLVVLVVVAVLPPSPLPLSPRDGREESTERWKKCWARGRERWESGEKEKKKVREKEMTLGQCVGPLFFSFLVKNITEWWCQTGGE